MERTELAEKAIALAEKRLPRDSWPEYYDTRSARFVGKQARLYQTWTLAGYLASKMFLKNPKLVSLLSWDEDLEILETCVCLLHKSGRIKCSRDVAKSQILVWSEREALLYSSQGFRVWYEFLIGSSKNHIGKTISSILFVTMINKAFLLWICKHVYIYWISHYRKLLGSIVIFDYCLLFSTCSLLLAFV